MGFIARVVRTLAADASAWSFRPDPLGGVSSSTPCVQGEGYQVSKPGRAMVGGRLLAYSV